MKIKKLEPNFKDERGVIQDILTDEQIDHVTVITSAKNVTRGNHYHKETIQWVYLHSGKIKSLTQNEGEGVVEEILEPGSLLKTDKMERHMLYSLEESIFFVFTKGPRGGDNYEDDTYRLDRSLEEELGK